ncbi:MAG: lipoprotein signal peptidase [Gammaproteobacteria bacterium]|jgi:signal peptidase II|nr:lipoprotein signal peptidase [Gammaproteobacteria bacterium]
MKNLNWLIISAFVIILDQWTKLLIVAHIQLGEVLPVVPHYFNLTLAYNTGAAFSFLAGMPGWQRWFFLAIALIVVIALVRWLMRLPPKNKWLATALSLIIGGALGNVIDRVRLSHVIDFIELYYKSFYWPAFNVADSAVVAGAIMLCIYYLFEKPASK